MELYSNQTNFAQYYKDMKYSLCRVLFNFNFKTYYYGNFLTCTKVDRIFCVMNPHYPSPSLKNRPHITKPAASALTFTPTFYIILKQIPDILSLFHLKYFSMYLYILKSFKKHSKILTYHLNLIIP